MIIFVSNMNIHVENQIIQQYDARSTPLIQITNVSTRSSWLPN